MADPKKPEPDLLRPFYFAVGAQQIFISHRIHSDLWVQVTQGECAANGGRDKIGTTREREVIALAVKLLNDDWVLNIRSISTEAVVGAMAAADVKIP